jgi:hypothetical protein
MARLRTLLVLLVAVALVPSATGASSSSVVVSQLFGGGGNAGAPFTHDFVELFNRSSSPVNLAGWTLQYATAAGTAWQATPLSGSIPPGGYFLVQLASGGTAGSALPTPDATGTTNAAATSGKIAIVRDAAELTCGATAGSCSANALVEDLVGYGSASDFEGAAAPALSSTTAAIRAGEGCTDTDANGSDFVEGAPAPRNSSAAAHACSSTPPPSGSDSETAAVDIDIDPVISIALERSTLSFGRAAAGSSPAPISERITVLSNNGAGYALSVQRTAFAPADLPLALQASAPAGGVLAPPFAGGAFVAIPVSSALQIGTTAAPSADGGDVWPTSVGFSGSLPVVAAGRYTATVTFTAVAR